MHRRCLSILICCFLVGTPFLTRVPLHRILRSIVAIIQTIGTAMNIMAVKLNAGRMPVIEDGLCYILDDDRTHQLLPKAKMRLWFLCDILQFRVNYFSLGDIFLCLGIIVAVFDVIIIPLWF